MEFLDGTTLARISAPALVFLAALALCLAYFWSGKQKHLLMFTLATLLVVPAMLNQAFDAPHNPFRAPTITNMLYFAGMTLAAIAISTRGGRPPNYRLATAIYLAISAQLWYFEAVQPLAYARIATVNFAGAVLFLLAADAIRPQRKKTRQDHCLFWAALLVGAYLLPRGIIFVMVSLVTDFEEMLASPIWVALQLNTAAIVALFLLVLVWCTIADIRDHRATLNAAQRLPHN